MSVISRIKDWYSKATIRVGGTGMAMNSGNWVGSSAPGNIYSNWFTGLGYFGGTYLNYEARVGPLYHNSAYMACVSAYQDAFSQAPICIKQMQADGTKQVMPNHELMQLLEQINQEDDVVTLMDATLIDYVGPGNAYWLIVPDSVGNPRELHYLPCTWVKPITAAELRRLPEPGEPNILWYEVSNGGPPERVEKEDIIHIRMGKDPLRPYMGLGRGAILLREIFADNESTNYTGAILNQMGIAQRIIQPKTYKDSTGTEMVAPFNGEEIAKMLAQSTTGDNRGKTVAINTLVDIHESQVTPEKMALDKIRQYPESRIAAVTRVPAKVAGLLVGEATSTFANYEEARESFWQDTVLPNMRRIRSQVTRQLIWRNEKYKARDIWFGFDYDKVPALQVDEQARDANIRENFKYGLVDAAEARGQMGLDPKPEDEGRMYKPNANPAEEEMDEEEAALARMVDGKAYVSDIGRISWELETLNALNGHHEDAEISADA